MEKNIPVTEEWRIRYRISGDNARPAYTEYENEEDARRRFSLMKKNSRYSFLQLLYYPFGQGDEMVDEVRVDVYEPAQKV